MKDETLRFEIRVGRALNTVQRLFGRDEMVRVREDALNAIRNDQDESGMQKDTREMLRQAYSAMLGSMAYNSPLH